MRLGLCAVICRLCCGWWLACALLGWGCSGIGPPKRDPLPKSELMVLLSFDVPPSEPPALAVLLAYPRAWGDCPDATIEAELDGVPLDPAPNATVRGDAICQIGFMPAAPPSPVDTSTIQLTRDTQTASVSIQGLLPTRTLATTVPDGATVAAGQTIDFVWSSARDAIASADAAFVSGNVMQHAQTE